MNWSDKQSYILTGGGRLESLYLDFQINELPHYHKVKGDTWEAAEKWKRNSTDKNSALCIAGVWNRALFVGGFKHSDATEETVFNFQTKMAFIDMRIPNTNTFVNKKGLFDFSDDELKLYARRHAFAGATIVDSHGIATRHHFIDWNYVGKMRPRPNKWRIEVDPHSGGNVWKELGWAKDEFGQSVYMERWERVEEGGFGPFLSMRRKPRESGFNDALLIVSGKLFAYIEDRPVQTHESLAANLTQLVDKCIDSNDRATAEKYLDLKAFCGSCGSEGWKINFSLQPWLIGTFFMPPCYMILNEINWIDDEWKILECGFKNSELAEILCISKQSIGSSL